MATIHQIPQPRRKHRAPLVGISGIADDRTPCAGPAPSAGSFRDADSEIALLQAKRLREAAA